MNPHVPVNKKNKECHPDTNGQMETHCSLPPTARLRGIQDGEKWENGILCFGYRATR